MVNVVVTETDEEEEEDEAAEECDGDGGCATHTVIGRCGGGLEQDEELHGLGTACHTHIDILAKNTFKQKDSTCVRSMHAVFTRGSLLDDEEDVEDVAVASSTTSSMAKTTPFYSGAS